MSNIIDFITKSNGKFLTVEFIKKDGTLRTMNGRTGVTKHLKGGVSTIDHSKYLVLFDTQASGYRCINKDTIVSVKCNGLKIQHNRG